VRNLALMDVYGRVARCCCRSPSSSRRQAGGAGAADPAGHRRPRRRLARHGQRIFKDLTTGGYVTVVDRQITINRKPPARW